MSIEDEILQLGLANPLPDEQMRSILKQLLAKLRARDPDGFEGRTDEEVIEDAMAKRKELAFVTGMMRLEDKKP